VVDVDVRTGCVALELRDIGGRKAPLLLTELVTTPDSAAFTYSTPIDGIHSRIIALFDRAVTKLQVCGGGGGRGRAAAVNSSRPCWGRALARSDAPHLHLCAVATPTPTPTRQGLPQLEPAIMGQLFWPNVPLLTSVHLAEEVTCKARDALSACIMASLQPLCRCALVLSSGVASSTQSTSPHSVHLWVALPLNNQLCPAGHTHTQLPGLLQGL
jgi:hypothetical protein